MKQSIYRLLGDKTFPIASYCSPMPAMDYNGVKYPRRITQEAYDMLASAGVNLFYGHSEVVGEKNTGDVQIALDCAARAGVGYMPRFAEAEEYISLGNRGYQDYRTMSEAERQNLDDRFARSLDRFASHPAFYGVSFKDEPGAAQFPMIARAKKVFEKVCGNDKFFYVNMLPYYVTQNQYEYGYSDSKKFTPVRDEYSTNHPNIQRYKTFVDEFLQVVNPEVYSYDAYPFTTLGAGAETGVHEVLWDIPCHLANIEKKTGVPFWMYMQEGGYWEGSNNVRYPTSGEHRLQYSVALAYGCKGIQLFPTCYPNDWIFDNVARAGLLDKNNQPTDMYHYFSREAKQIRAVGRYLLDTERKGIMVSGRYDNMLAAEKVLQKIMWNECIFRGKLPGEQNVLLSTKTISKITASSQVIAGCFEKDGQERFYLVNNSSTTSANASVRLNVACDVYVIRNGLGYTVSGKEISLKGLEPGEGVYFATTPKEGK